MRIGPTGRTLAAFALIACLTLSLPSTVRAETVLVAVAANFIDALKVVAKGFEAETGHTLKISSGSTGQLYAQIKHGAPFDVFLSADEESPAKLEAGGAAVMGSRFTYATGQLVWWHRDTVRVTAPDRISRNQINTIAIANPKLAPYGRAAKEVMDKKPDWLPQDARVVYGQNIAQTYAMVVSGNADAGLVARSQVQGELNDLTESLEIMKPIDPNLHEPIRQDAVLMKRAATNPAATAFMAYLKSPAARKIIAGFGYLEGGH